jgi:hypothetical protein
MPSECLTVRGPFDTGEVDDGACSGVLATGAIEVQPGKTPSRGPFAVLAVLQ